MNSTIKMGGLYEIQSIPQWSCYYHRKDANKSLEHWLTVGENTCLDPQKNSPGKLQTNQSTKFFLQATGHFEKEFSGSKPCHGTLGNVVWRGRQSWSSGLGPHGSGVTHAAFFWASCSLAKWIGSQILGLIRACRRASAWLRGDFRSF